MHIYQLPISLYSFKLRLALGLKGVSIASREPPGGSYRTAEYRAINPAGTIPALISGDLMLTETDSIIEYLDDIGEGAQLLPSDAKARARTRMLSRWVDLKLEANIRSLFAHVAPSGRDATMVVALDQTIAERLTLIEEAMDNKGPFMLGPTPGMADCGLIACLCWLNAIRGPLALKAQANLRATRAFSAMAADTRVATEIKDYSALIDAWAHGKIAT